MKKTAKFTTLALAAMMLAGCAASADAATRTPASLSGGTPASELRIGYFANVTHAPALVGLQEGIFAKDIDAKITTQLFNAGPATIEALTAGAIDAAFIGPSPSINSYIQSAGRSVRIVAGATTGGAALVVKSDITRPADLKGKTIATPQLGNTQDVALRAFVKSQGLNTDTSGGGDVSIIPQANADTLTQFASGDIDGAWVPEPFFTRLQQESGGKVLVDEKTLWPGGQFVTTQLIVATKFLNAHPDAVLGLIKGEADAIKFINDSPADAQKVANDGIAKISGKPLKDAVVAAAFQNLSFTLDPVASSLKKSAQDAYDVGLLKSTDIDGLYDLTLLNSFLSDSGKSPVQGL
jgi:NitT/TauT family transport system substrate-binding protein